MNKKILFGSGLLLIVALTSVALANSGYFTALQSVYGTTGTSCGTCHVTTSPVVLTAYGTSFAAVSTHSTNPTGALCSIGAPSGTTTNNCPTPTGVIVFVSPPTQDAAPGANINVDVKINSGTTNVQYAYVELNYDTTNLTANSVTSGTLLGADALTEPGSGITSGKVKYGLARTSTAAAPVNGTFITVQFTVKSIASGRPKLDLDNVNLMSSLTANIANPTVNDGEVNVSGTPVTPTPPPGTGGATVFVSPPTQVVAPGANFNVDVKIDSGSANVQFAHVELNFDATKLTANSVTASNLLGADALTEPGSGISAGTIKYGLARTSTAAAPVNGTFITVQFTAKSSASGIYVLDLANVDLMNSTTSHITNPNVTDGAVNVSGTPVLKWAFISVPYQLNNSTIAYVLNGIQYDGLFGFDPVNKVYVGGVTNFEPLKGYLIHMDISQDITNIERRSGQPQMPPSLDVKKGWNLIGTTDTTARNAETMLGAIDPHYYSIWNFDVSTQSYDIVGENGKTGILDSHRVGTDVFMMQPKVSYWVWANQDDSLPAYSP